VRQVQIAGETVEYNVESVWSTPQEANAYREGIEFVNDSAVSVVGVIEKDGQYSVLILDEDQ
jgi:hypothetical protein